MRTPSRSRRWWKARYSTSGAYCKWPAYWNTADIPTDIVGIGSIVKMTNLENDDEWEFTIVGCVEADPDNDLISDESPIGEAIMGKKVDDTVFIQVPNGALKYHIRTASRKRKGGRNTPLFRPVNIERQKAKENSFTFSIFLPGTVILDEQQNTSQDLYNPRRSRQDPVAALACAPSARRRA